MFRCKSDKYLHSVSEDYIQTRVKGSRGKNMQRGDNKKLVGDKSIKTNDRENLDVDVLVRNIINRLCFLLL